MIKALVVNKEELRKGNMVSRWIDLPKTSESLKNELLRIGIDDISTQEQYYISECQSDMPALDDRVKSTTDLETLNVIALSLADISQEEKARLGAVLELYPKSHHIDLVDIITNYDDHWHLTHIDSYWKLGAYALEKMGLNLKECPSYVHENISLDPIGRAVAEINNGQITQYGYMQRGTALNLTEATSQENTINKNGFYIEIIAENAKTLKYAAFVLPLSETELSYYLQDIDILEYSKENTSILSIDYPTYDFSNAMGFLYLSPSMDLIQLNRLAMKVSQMNDIELDTYGKLIEQITGYGDIPIEFLVDIAENIDKFDILPEVKHTIDLGRHYYESANPGANPLTEQEYEHQGNLILERQGGIFTDIGYMYCTDENYTPKQGKIPCVTNVKRPVAAAVLENGITYHFPMYLDYYTPIEQWHGNPNLQIKEVRSNVPGIPMDQSAMNCQLAELNGLCEKISRFSMSDLQKYKAMAVVAYEPSCAFLNELADNIGRYEHLPDIHRAEDLGAYCLDQGLVEDFDYESENLGDDLLHMCTLGGNFMDEYGGTFTDYGFIYCKDKDFQLTQGRFKTMDEMIQGGHDLMF